MTLRLRTLGGLAIEGEGQRPTGAGAQRKPLALLALLAAAGEAGVSRDKVLAYLWPESPSGRASHSLRQLLHSLRRDLDEDAVFLSSTDLRLNPHVMSSDVGDFNDALAREDLERAVSLYAGPFLDGFHPGGVSFELERWIELERDRLAKRFRGALESLASAAERQADRSAAATWWGRLAEVDPFNARVTIGYMETLSAAGDRAGALQAARAHQARLGEELDAEPDRAVEAAAERIRRPVGDAAATPQLAATLQPSSGAQGSPHPDVRLAAPPPASLAVLPFVNLSPEPEDEYFSDGMTDELTNALGRVEGLRVAAQTSAFAFKGRADDARRIGERLNVLTLIEGSVRKAGDRVRITAHLVNAADGFQLWSGTYERPLADVFAVQEELSRAIVEALSSHLTELAGAPRIEPATQVLEAYTSYLRGRFFANKRTLEGLRTAIECFGEALRADPRYALAHAGLAEAYALLGFPHFGDLPPREAMPKAKAAASQALALDPDLAQAHTWMGVVAFLYDWDWPAAEAEFRRALHLRPGPALAHAWYALFLAAMGRHEESIREATRAQALEPLWLLTNVHVGRCYYFARRYEDAIRQLRLALEMEPRHEQTHEFIARTLCATGRFREALLELERGMEVVGRSWRLLAIYGYACAALGMRREALEKLEELRQEARRGYVSPSGEALILKGLGDADGMFQAHERAIAERSGFLPLLRADPLNEPVRSDPRFAALCARLRIPGPAGPGE